MSNLEYLKQQAAARAVDYVESGMAIGLGTGSTACYVVKELGHRLAEGRLHSVTGIATSEHTAQLATSLHIPLTTFDEYPKLDMVIDGADEIAPNLDLIKGRGGALLWEKIVASAARQLVIVADKTKLVSQLGSRCPIPIEVVPMAVPIVKSRLQAMGGSVTLRKQEDGQRFCTDEGNHILDYSCKPLKDPRAFDTVLLRIPGVVDHGLFLGMAQCAVVANEESIHVIEH